MWEECFTGKNVYYGSILSADVSIEVPPESKSGGKRLTEEEENEYHQIQGMKLVSLS